MPMQVRCEYVDWLVDACYHKGLPPGFSEAFEEHITNCSNCQEQLKHYESELRYRLLRVLSEEAADVGAPELVEELWGRFLLERELPL